MFNKKILQISICIVWFIVSLWLLTNISNAAASFEAEITKISNLVVGDTFTITVRANNAAGMYGISTNNDSILSLISGSKSEFLDNGSAEITFKAIKEGTVTITAKSEDMSDLDDSSKEVTGSKVFTVTVKPKTSSSSGGSGSSSGGSSSSGSSTTTPKLSFTSKNETVYVTADDVNVRSNYSTSSSVIGSLDKGDSVTRTGIASKTLEGISWSKISYNGKTAYVSSSFLTTTKPVIKEDKDEDDKPEKQEETENKKSDNTNLKTLEVMPTGLSPAYSNVTTEYTMTVDSDVDNIEIKAVAEDEKAKISISGNEDLEVGENTIKIKVTAEDGTIRTYVISVTKQEKEQLKLKELLIEGLPLKPEFDSNIYEYTIDLDKGDISELNITATADRKNAEIEIVGNTDLKAGENLITILVKSNDGEEITTYQITANIPEIVKDIVVLDNSIYKYVGFGLAVIVLVILIIIFIRKIRNREDEDFEEEYELNDKVNNIEEISKTEDQNEINLEDLPKLEDEDLPKSLRKEPVQGERTEVEQQRRKKIDELYALSEEGSSKKRRGKHF